MLEYITGVNGFAVKYKGRTIITHSMTDPCICSGSGTASIETSHGVYKLKKDTITCKEYCSDFTIYNTADEAIDIIFGSLVTLHCRVIDGRLHITFSGYDETRNRFWISLAAMPGEHVYGCGERFGKLDLRGHDVPIWVTEPGIGRGRDYVGMLAELHSRVGGAWHNTYFPMPTFVSSENWYFHAEADSYARFNFKKKDRFVLYFWQVPKTLVIGVSDSAVDTIGELSAYLGRQPLLPEWVYDGVWLAAQGGTGAVREKVRKARDAGVELSAIWSQDWQGIRKTPYGTQLMWNWEYDNELYNGLPGFIDELHEAGIKFLGYNNCFLAMDSEQYKEGSLKEYFVKDGDGKDYEIYTSTFPVAMVDLTNPEAWQWYKQIIKKNMIGIGMDGWMADFGEYLPVDSIIYNGDPMLYHNPYPAEWAKLNREAVEEEGKTGEVVFFSRSGFTRSPRYSPLFWAGDQLVTFHQNHGLQSVIQAGISMGICSCGFYHFDIGGFFSILWIKRNRDLWMRSAEMAAFTQVMRSHEGINPEVNCQFDSSSEILSHLARMTKVYTHLKEYHKYCAREYTEKGLPPMRHPYIHYENDKTLHDLKYQYMYGPDLMVAPVIKKRQKKRKLYLPEDRWIHAWSGREYGSGRHRVNAPMGEPPVFYRKNSSFAELFAALKDM